MSLIEVTQQSVNCSRTVFYFLVFWSLYHIGCPLGSIHLKYL